MDGWIHLFLFNLPLPSDTVAIVVSILWMEVLSSGRRITCSRSYTQKATEAASQSSLQTLSPVFSSLPQRCPVCSLCIEQMAEARWGDSLHKTLQGRVYGIY